MHGSGDVLQRVQSHRCQLHIRCQQHIGFSDLRKLDRKCRSRWHASRLRRFIRHRARIHPRRQHRRRRRGQQRHRLQRVRLRLRFRARSSTCRGCSRPGCTSKPLLLSHLRQLHQRLCRLPHHHGALCRQQQRHRRRDRPGAVPLHRLRGRVRGGRARRGPDSGAARPVPCRRRPALRPGEAGSAGSDALAAAHRSAPRASPPPTVCLVAPCCALLYPVAPCCARRAAACDALLRLDAASSCCALLRAR